MISSGREWDTWLHKLKWTYRGLVHQYMYLCLPKHTLAVGQFYEILSWVFYESIKACSCYYKCFKSWETVRTFTWNLNVYSVTTAICKHKTGVDCKQ